MAEGFRLQTPPGNDNVRVQLGRYRLIESVGTGGAGEVFAAYDPELDRRVALKVVDTRGSEMKTNGGWSGKRVPSRACLTRTSSPFTTSAAPSHRFSSPWS